MITGQSLPVDGGQLAVAGIPLGGFSDILTERTRGGDLHPTHARTTQKDSNGND